MKRSKHNIWYVVYSYTAKCESCKRIRKIYTFLYMGATVYLKRKKQRFEKILKQNDR